MRIDKRYQVFVSSTYIDLVDERREIMQALLELDCIPSGMELFQAADEDSWSLIQSVIDDCDYYIVVVAGRYGTTHPKTGISYTEMEYRYALEKQVPIISFLHEDISKLSSVLVDSGDDKVKLDEFIKLCQAKQVKYWKNASDLGSVVSRSLVRLTKEKPGIGWVRADTLASDDAREALLRIKEENEKLKSELSNAKSAYQGDITKLAQGSDPIDITWHGRYQEPVAHGYNYNNKASYSINGEITIDALFSRIAPAMVDEITESQLRSRVSVFFSEIFENESVEIEYRKDKNSKVNRFYTVLDDISVTDSSFQLLKVQLMALNLIERGKKRRPPSDKANYWKITDDGERKMMSLLAIKRPDHSE